MLCREMQRESQCERLSESSVRGRVRGKHSMLTRNCIQMGVRPCTVGILGMGQGDAMGHLAISSTQDG